ncbi:MAG: hypothetical protein M3P33_01395 [bacterium]|nr:hypothetical protein [bacterium]
MTQEQSYTQEELAQRRREMEVEKYLSDQSISSDKEAKRINSEIKQPDIDKRRITVGVERKNVKR